MKLPQIFLTGTGEKTVTVNEGIFGGAVNLELIAQAIYVYQSNQRTAHAQAKTRGEVSRTTAKWYKQKGTGRARHGARSAPIFVGGGKAHGPTGTQNYKKTLSQGMKVAALRSALAAQVEEKTVFIGQGAEKLKGQTKELSSFVKDLEGRILVVMADNEAFLRAARNLDQIQVTRAQRLNAFEVAQADRIVVLAEALPLLEERLMKTASKKAEKPAPAAKKTTRTKKTAEAK